MKILYIGFSRPDYSIDGIYINGLRKNGVEVVEAFFPEDTWKRLQSCIRAYLSHKHALDAVIIGYASPQAVIALWPWCRHMMIYNALCSEFERKIISRKLAPRVSFKGYYYWLLDYLAVRCASLVMLESDHQIEYFKQMFGCRKKYFRAWTGVDGEKYFYRPNIRKREQFTALFRGRLLPEAGGECVVEAAKKLEGTGIQFLMMASGMELPKVQKLIETLQPSNLQLITAFLPIEEVRTKMQECHISLGQLSAHDRLTRTIPHKAYETLALGLPYLTARNPAVMELLKEGETCLACNPADADDLAKKILWAKEHQRELEAIAQAGHHLYQEQLTSSNLATRLIERLNTLSK
jgi:glycosyltransferase involved in cell wall biosynthesis